jgi:hypothetical protein
MYKGPVYKVLTPDLYVTFFSFSFSITSSVIIVFPHEFGTAARILFRLRRPASIESTCGGKSFSIPLFVEKEENQSNTL